MKNPARDLLSGDGASSSDEEDLNNIEIDEDYVRRFEHNKKREDLQRHEELRLKGLIDSEFDDDQEIDDSSGDDDDDDVMDDIMKSDVKYFEVLNRIKKRDPELVHKEVVLFDDVAEDEKDDDVAIKKKEKKKKKVYLKDVNANMLLEEGAEFNDEDDDVEIKDKRSYFEEVEANRNEFLKAVENEEGSDDGEEFFKVKEKTKEEDDEDVVEYEKKVDEYFEDGPGLNENEKFLKEYFLKRMWLGKDDEGNGHVDEVDVSDDDEEIWKQMDYERDRNFRHEEGVEDRVNVYARKVEDSVRKVENARKRQRESKKERMAQAELERKEELKRLKNLKKKEMNEKIRKIREIAGIGEDGECVLDERDLEEEFDPEKYDLKMKKTFDDKFYDAEDVDPAFGSDDEDEGKPNFDEEDKLLGLPKGWGDEFGPDDGFKAIREKILKKKGKKGENGVEEVEEENEEEEAVVKEGKKKKRKTKSSQLEEELVKKELEEYYKLEYEGNIGDLKTRFKYRPVKTSNYGLKAKEILLVDEKELNQLIPMKKLATYRDDEFHVPYNKIKEQKEKIRSLLKGESSNGSNSGGKRLKNDAGKPVKQVDDAETKDVKSETQDEGEKKLSKKQKRKMRAQEFKLESNRRMAYGMDVPKKKKKSKA